MWNVRSILCPTDFSAPSEAALEHALELARRFGAGVRLIHAIELPPYLSQSPFVELATGGVTLQEHMRARSDRALADRLAGVGVPEGVRLTHEVLEGDPRRAILAASEDADLIVMGTHGRTGIAQLLMGSVAEHVVRMSEVPVLTVRTPPAGD